MRFRWSARTISLCRHFLDNYYKIKSRYHRLQVISLQDNKGQFIALPIEMTEKAICDTMFTNFCKSTPGAFDT